MKSGTTGTTKCYLAFVIVTCLMPLLLRTGTATIATTQPHNGEFPTATLHNGIRIPLIGLGCASGVRKSHVQSALSLGYQLLDTAQASQWGYHEDEVGRALTDFLKENNSANVFLQTKIHPEDLGYEATTNAVHKSLERLNGYLDSVLIHKPRCWEGACSRKSEGTWQDSWRALEDLYDQGLIKAIGICDVDDSLLNELLRQRIKPHIIQNWMDPLHQDVKIREKSLSLGIQYQAYSSLGTQWVHFRGYDTNPVLTHPMLVAIAQKYNVDVGQVTLNWATRHGISVLPASTNPKRQQSNLNSYATFDLTEEEMKQIDDLDGKVPRTEQQQQQQSSGVQVHFENPRQDGSAIDAYWISASDEHEEVSIGSIAAGGRMSLTSYHGHKFVFRDPSNGNLSLGEYTVNASARSKSDHRHVIQPTGEL